MQTGQSNPLLLLITIVFFIIGFLIVAKLIDYFQNKKLTQNANKSNDNNDKGINEQDRTWQNNYEERKHESKEEYVNPEIKYKSIFGFVGPYSKDDVKKRYRELISKYHPDKVHHLGKEFQVIAEEKTKMIHEAYKYFKETYNIKD